MTYAYWLAERDERVLALEGALIDLVDLHHRTLTGSRKHDPEHQEFWDCECRTCARVVALVGESPLFRTWQAKAREDREAA